MRIASKQDESNAFFAQSHRIVLGETDTNQTGYEHEKGQ
jgi:hypothetical protein